MREVVSGPWRGKHPPNISDVSLPLTLRHTRTNRHSQSHTYQPTHPPRHTYTHTPHTSIQTDTPRLSPSLTDTLTHTHTHTPTHPPIQTNTHTHPLTQPAIGRPLDLVLGGEYIEDRQGVRIIVLSRRVRVIFENTDYCCAKEIWLRMMK